MRYTAFYLKDKFIYRWSYTKAGSMLEIPVSYSRLLGLLRLLRDLGGKADVAKISEETDMHADEILPLLAFSEMIGLISVDEGDAKLTESGMNFLKQGHMGRAKYVRNKLMELNVFSEIMNELKKKGSLEKEDVIEIIASKGGFCYCNNLEEAFNCLVHWGVYSGLIEYDREENLIRLGEVNT
ncbi:MAG: AAA-associated domain-containing protein [Candidatus Methanodesulfokora sp.]